MLKETARYDASLEAYARPLTALIDYDLDEAGHMTVHSAHDAWYRYPDMTAQATSLFEFIEQTIEVELVTELDFLSHYEETKRSIQEFVDMPDREIDLFIRFGRQNHGGLSKRRREARFSFLSDEEVLSLEEAIRTGFQHEDQ